MSEENEQPKKVSRSRRGWASIVIAIAAFSCPFGMEYLHDMTTPPRTEHFIIEAIFGMGIIAVLGPFLGLSIGIYHLKRVPKRTLPIIGIVLNALIILFWLAVGC